MLVDLLHDCLVLCYSWFQLCLVLVNIVSKMTCNVSSATLIPTQCKSLFRAVSVTPLYLNLPTTFWVILLPNQQINNLIAWLSDFVRNY